MQKETGTETVVDDSELTQDHDTDLRSDASSRLLEVYDQIASSDDVALKTAALLTTNHYYTYALRISNAINGRQGRSRATVTYQTSRLMGYSLETDVNSISDDAVYRLFIEILNQYLADKQELPYNQPKKAAGILSRVKALLIMLVVTDQYGVIPNLILPKYILSYVSELFEIIREIKDSVLEDWIDWLIANNNPEMADIVKAAGNEFWGSEGIKANVIYDRYFGHMRERINKPTETYAAYKKFRAEYRKTTKNIIPSKIYKVFDITPDQYRRARENVYIELKQLYPEDENIKVIQRLIFET